MELLDIIDREPALLAVAIILELLKRKRMIKTLMQETLRDIAQEVHSIKKSRNVIILI